MIRAIDALHTGNSLFLRMPSPILILELDADYGHVLAVARVMGGLSSIELEVLLFSDATYVKPPTIIPCLESNQPRASRHRVQGVPLDWMDLSFYQVLQLIGDSDLLRGRTTGNVFVGLSQTGPRASW